MLDLFHFLVILHLALAANKGMRKTVLPYILKILIGKKYIFIHDACCCKIFFSLRNITSVNSQKYRVILYSTIISMITLVYLFSDVTKIGSNRKTFRTNLESLSSQVHKVPKSNKKCKNSMKTINYKSFFNMAR